VQTLVKAFQFSTKESSYASLNQKSGNILRKESEKEINTIDMLTYNN